MKQYLNKVQHMDCIEFLKLLPDNSVDSCITDPPYGLHFMGEEWDNLTSQPGIGSRPTDWVSHSSTSRFTQPNRTCAICGGRERGKKKCHCEKPEWKPIGKRKSKEIIPEGLTGGGYTKQLRIMQEWHYQWALEVFRVLRPGAHILSFSGTRTYHRLACAIEDAGFEIRDQIHWLYGSGFPKGQNIAKAIDKKKFNDWLKEHPKEHKKLKRMYTKLAELNEEFGTRSDRYGNYKEKVDSYESELSRRAGAEGEIIKEYDSVPGLSSDKGWNDGPFSRGETGMLRKPASKEAQQWTGWNTQLKPAHEPIVLARKPLSESSIVDNVLKHGTGALNIDATRVSVNPEVDDIGKTTERTKRQEGVWEKYSGFLNPINPMAGVLPSGRYPANLILSHHSECDLIQEGETRVESKPRDRLLKTGEHPVGIHGIYGKGKRSPVEYNHDAGTHEIWNCVEGCPVRELNEQSGNSKSNVRKNGGDKFFPPERGWNQHSMTRKGGGFTDSGGAARFFYCPKPSITERNRGLMGDRNVHITVKPLELMRWLVKLVTPKNGIVLDPFLGSGTTAIAAENEGFDWVGCELNEEYAEIARLRIKALGGRQSTIGEFMEEDQ